MYGENTKTIAIPIYRVLPYPVIPLTPLQIIDSHFVSVVFLLVEFMYMYMCVTP